MRVVLWAEFAKLPAGTIYSKRDGKNHGDGFDLWRGLYLKGEMRADDADHWESDLIPYEDGDRNEGAVFDLSQSASAFEGHEAYHYAIFEKADLQSLLRVVQQAITVA